MYKALKSDVYAAETNNPSFAAFQRKKPEPRTPAPALARTRLRRARPSPCFLPLAAPSAPPRSPCQGGGVSPATLLAAGSAAARPAGGGCGVCPAKTAAVPVLRRDAPPSRPGRCSESAPVEARELPPDSGPRRLLYLEISPLSMRVSVTRLGSRLFQFEYRRLGSLLFSIRISATRISPVSMRVSVTRISSLSIRVSVTRISPLFNPSLGDSDLGSP